MTLATLSRAGRLALDLLYPPRCVLCGHGGAFVCESCASALPRADGHRCDRCWLPLVPGNDCSRCAEWPLALTTLRSAFRYEGNVRRLVRAFKFEYQSCLAAPIASLLLDTAPDVPDFDAIVPVPLAGRRQRERGFNQTLLMAKELSRATGLPVVQALARTKNTPHNALSQSREERRRNVQGVFALQRGANVTGRTLLLLDDVATTGATLDACARVLVDAGAAAVHGLTLARED